MPLANDKHSVIVAPVRWLLAFTLTLFVVGFAGCSLGLDDIPDPGADAGGPSGPCIPETCAKAAANCGLIKDNCGGVVFCGLCDFGETCGGNGPNRCGSGTCTNAVCGTRCGLQSNNCDSVLDCLGCSFPNTCGGGDKKDECGCTPPTCESVGAECGFIPDPCSTDNAIQCDVCAGGKVCGADGHLNKCGDGECQPRTCVEDEDCGQISDGCGNFLVCGSCATGKCGVTAPNKCGCGEADCGKKECGSVQDACGAPKVCGESTSPEACGGTSTQPIDGVPGFCSCIPHTCETLNATCGTALDDGCGATIKCGPDSCDDPTHTCGANGVCACTPRTCTPDDCGNVDDGCQGTQFCCCHPGKSCLDEFSMSNPIKMCCTNPSCPSCPVACPGGFCSWG